MGLVALLALSLLLMAGLAFEARRSERLHRGAVDKMLGDLVASAAWTYRLAISEALGNEISPALYPVTRWVRQEQARILPALSVLRDNAESTAVCRDRKQNAARFYFRYLPTDSSMTFLGPEPDSSAKSLLVNRLRVNAMMREIDAFFLIRYRDSPIGPRGLVFGFRRAPGGELVAVYGFETCSGASSGKFLAAAATSRLLLPTSLVGATVNDSVLSVVAIYGLTQDTIYRSPIQYRSPYTAVDTTWAGKKGLAIYVTLRSEVATRILRDTVPRSRLPILLGLLVLAAAGLLVTIAALNREQALTAARSDFVASVSHELRTPLAQILLFAETLDLGRAPAEDDRNFAVRVILRETRRLIHLVENVLHFAVGRRGTLLVQRKEMPIAPLVYDIAEGFTPLAAERGASLELDLDDDIVAEVDEGAFRQILLNLLDNALKFGPRGQTVTVGLSQSADVIRLYVDDQGAGVRMEDRHRIWDPFVRADPDTNRAPGSGMGLAVVRDLVKLHQGRAYVEGAPGRGARVVIELPKRATS